MASYWPTLGKDVGGLERAGKLVRVTTPVNKDTELHPLVRLQFRGLPENQRKAVLFENGADSPGRKYDMPGVVGGVAASSGVDSVGMGAPVKEISGKWRAARAKPLTPVEVKQAA